MSDYVDDGLPPWPLDEEGKKEIRGKNIPNIISDDDPFSNEGDFFPADWKPKTIEIKTPVKVIVPPPMPEKGKWHRNWFSNMMDLSDAGPFIYQGISYNSTESFYQAMKLPKNRLDLRRQIAEMEGRKAKLAVRDKEKFPCDLEGWKDKSLKIMELGLRHKFRPDTSWNKTLMDTGEEDIIEWNNWHDVFWGRDIATNEGENHLGKLLMRLRSEYLNTKVIKKSSGEKGIAVDRGTIFGNPFSHIKDRDTKAEFIVETREESIAKHKEYFKSRIAKDKEFRLAVQKLRGETLVCHCVPLSCHAETIRDWLFKNIDID